MQDGHLSNLTILKLIIFKESGLVPAVYSLSVTLW